jgi:hypothetical protein
MTSAAARNTPTTPFANDSTRVACASSPRISDTTSWIRGAENCGFAARCFEVFPRAVGVVMPLEQRYTAMDSPCKKQTRGSLRSDLVARSSTRPLHRWAQRSRWKAAQTGTGGCAGRRGMGPQAWAFRRGWYLVVGMAPLTRTSLLRPPTDHVDRRRGKARE